MKRTIGNVAHGGAQSQITEETARAARAVRPSSLRARPELALIGFLAVVIIIGYEWLMSGPATSVADSPAISARNWK